MKMQPTVIRFSVEERAAIDRARGLTPLGVWIRKACAQAMAPDGDIEDLRAPQDRLIASAIAQSLERPATAAAKSAISSLQRR